MGNTKKFFKNFIMATMTMFGFLLFFETEVKADTWGAWVYEGNQYEATITGYTGTDANVTVPSSINGKVVVALRGAFYNNQTVQTVTIPDSVKIIDSQWGIPGTEDKINDYVYWDTCYGAFENCRNLTKVNGAKGVVAYGEETFKECTKLTSVKLYKIDSIPGKMFLGCSRLVNISIPTSVKAVGYWAFAECSSLQNVYGGTGAKEYGEAVYRSCKNLRTVNLGKTKTIPMFMFYRCAKLTSIKLPTTLTSIQYSAFAFSGLKSVALPSSLQYVGGGREDETDRDGAFEGCKSLTKVTGGKNVQVYGVCAFRNCKNLQSFSFGKITKIQRFVFAGCSNLKSVNLPTTLKILGTGAFQDCKKLSKVKLPYSLHTVGKDVFAGCTALKSISIPSKVTSIYESAIPEHTKITVKDKSEAAYVFITRPNLKVVK